VTFLDEIKARAVAQGINTAVIFLSSMTVIPTGAGPYLLLRETGGSGPERTQNVTSGAWYREIVMLQEPFDLGPDALNRAQVAGNLTATKRPS